MLETIAFVPVCTLDGKMKTRQLFWDFATHRSMVNVAAKEDNETSIFILRNYPGAISGMLKDDTSTITKLDAYTIPLQTMVVNDEEFMEHLNKTIRLILQKENARIIKNINEVSGGMISKEKFQNIYYPNLEVGEDDVTDKYRALATNGNSTIIYRSINFGHGVILRSDSLHQILIDNVETNEDNYFLTQLSLIIMKNSTLLGDYSIFEIREELKSFFSDLVVWLYENEYGDSDLITPFKMKEFSTLKIKALSSIL